ncbi:MAG: glycosyltransferase family 4 protein [Pseudomonadota bacterium]
MNILFCVEFYYPSLGGAQEVVRQLAERLASRGHTVTVATSQITSRSFDMHKGVCIIEFAISGNQVRGLQGDVETYHAFLKNSDFDVVLFYAAQQWTFDAAWPVMESISARKVLVPCGYSGLFEPAYKEYFSLLPAILRQMAAVIYHAENYRDVAFGQASGIKHGVMISNGADLEEFSVPNSQYFRHELSIPDSALLFLTVGTMTGLKGHLELAKAFYLADFGGRDAVLILNGNTPEFRGKKVSSLRQLFNLVRGYGFFYAAKHSVKMLLHSLGIRVGKAGSIQDWVLRINGNKDSKKHVIVADLPRTQLIQAYLNADLFVFASNVEYSPLVLFEACAAGLPFLSVPVGNSVEIATWTGGGEICPAETDDRGYTRVSPDELARRMEALAADSDSRFEMGRRGKLSIQGRFNWDMLVQEYEALFIRVINKPAPLSEQGNEWSTPQFDEARNCFE